MLVEYRNPAGDRLGHLWVDADRESSAMVAGSAGFKPLASSLFEMRCGDA